MTPSDGNMGRMRRVLALVALALLVVGCGLLEGHPGAERRAAKHKTAEAPPQAPNVVVLLADDLDAALLKRYPEQFPNITALMEGGAAFENAFVTDPVCCPSRVTFLRGQYAHNHRVEQVPGGGEPDFRAIEHRSLPVWMRDVGYATAYIGPKYLNGWGGEHRPPGWTAFKAEPTLRAADGVHYVPGYNKQGRDTEGRTHTEVFSEYATTFVENRAGATPYLLYFSPFAPHDPGAHPARYDALFADAQAPRPPSYNEPDTSDKPPWLAGKPPLDQGRLDAADELYRDMARATKDVDDAVGRIVAALERTGELESTYIFFTSDNGYRYGVHRLPPGKWTAFEEDIRVPLAVKGPGIPAATRGEIVLNNDLVPTLADLAGFPAPPFADGRSYAPLLRGESPQWRDAFLVEAVRYEAMDRPAFKAVRTADGRSYVEYATGGRESYDLRQDPHQLDNLAADPARADEKAALAARLDALRNCAGESCRAAEDAP